MKAEFKEELSYSLVMSLLCVGVFASGIFSVLFGDLLIPVIAALLAVIFTLESKAKRVLSYIIPAFLVILNVASLLLFDGYVSFFGIFAVLLGVVISSFFARGGDKSDCVFLMTFVGTLFVVLSFVYFAMTYTHNYSFSAVPEFVSLIRVAFYNFMEESLSLMLSSVPDFDEQFSSILSQIGAVFDSFKMVSLSFAVIIGFVVSGVALKFYSFLLFKLSDCGTAIFEWRFRLPRVFAYFYVILSLISVFILSSNTLVAVTVVNLYNIFMVIYAYFGFNFAVYLLSSRRSRGFAYVILIIAILAFSSLAIEILSLMGAFFAITDRRSQDENS